MSANYVGRVILPWWLECDTDNTVTVLRHVQRIRAEASTHNQIPGVKRIDLILFPSALWPVLFFSFKLRFTIGLFSYYCTSYY